MLPNQSPDKGDRCDRPDDDATQWDVTTPRWVVTDEHSFATAMLKPGDTPVPYCYFELSEAVYFAQQYSADDGGLSMYVWHWPHPEGERKATAIVCNGATFLSPADIETITQVDALKDGEKGGDGHANSPSQWAVTTLSNFLIESIKELDPEQIFSDFHQALEWAIAKSVEKHLEDYCLCIWPFPYPHGARQARAIVLNGEAYTMESDSQVDRHSTSPTNGLRSAFPWTFTDNGESIMDVGLTKREHFTLELAKAILGGRFHKGSDPHYFFEHNWDLIRDVSIRMSADLLAALAGETLEGDPPCEQLLAELRGDKT